MKVYFMTILLTYLASGLIYAQESVGNVPDYLFCIFESVTY